MLPVPHGHPKAQQLKDSFSVEQSHLGLIGYGDHSLFPALCPIRLFQSQSKIPGLQKQTGIWRHSLSHPVFLTHSETPLPLKDQLDKKFIQKSTKFGCQLSLKQSQWTVTMNAR